MAADGDTDYDVENREYKDVTITLHTRWDAADITGTLYQNIVVLYPVSNNTLQY